MSKEPGPVYIAFQNSEKLWRNSEQFISNMRAGVSDSQIPLLVQVMHGFLDEAIDVYILRPVDIVQLNPVGQKMVNLSVATIKKTCHFVSKKVLQKMTNKDVRQLAEYMDQLMVIMPNREGLEVAFTAIPVSVELTSEMDALITDVHQGNPRDCIDRLTYILEELFKVAVKYLYSNTLEHLKLGTISKKLIEVSYHTVDKAVHTAVINLIPRLSDEQLVIAAEYYEGLIVHPSQES